MAEDDTIPLTPLDDEDEKHRKEEIEHCLEMQEALLSEQTGEAVVPLEHRENLSARDMDHLVVNYCLDNYNGNGERCKVHLAKMRPHRDIAIQSAGDFLAGRITEKALKIMMPEELTDCLKDLIEQLRLM